MASNQGRGTRPYRKASEYLQNSQKQSPSDGNQMHHSKEYENQSQAILVLTRKLERAEAEFEQSREYWENQLDLARDRELRISEQYKRLQSSYAALQATNRELEEKVSKINRLEAEKNLMVKEINELTNKITDSRNSLFKAQEENERLRKDCNLAVQLLKCNQASYKAPQPNQLPENVQAQISSFKVELQDYNEYINPYADGSDSDSDTGAPQRRTHISQQAAARNHQNDIKGGPEGIPIEFLAETLVKPENVHLNLEASDYVQDPALHSIYKARYLDKRLIKPDYGEEDTVKKADINKSSISAQEPIQGPTSPQQNVAQEETSPWELAPSRRGVPTYSEDADDGSPAGAYGAYSVGPKRRVVRRQPETDHQLEKEIKQSPEYRDTYQKRSESFSAAVRAPSPDNLEFRMPSLPQSSSGISNYFSKPPKSSPSISSSSNTSSKKSTPLKVRGKERASVAETSSLLHQSGSEDDDIKVDVTHYPSNHASPNKSYLKKENVKAAEAGSLLHNEDDEADQVPPSCGGIDLEWEVEIPIEDATETPEISNLISEVEHVTLDEQVVNTKPEPNLLLSYNPIESPAKSSLADLEDLVLSTPEHKHIGSDDDGLSLLGSGSFSPQSNPSGQLLSEIVTNNPSLSSFLMAPPPPPPQEFSSQEADFPNNPLNQYEPASSTLYNVDAVVSEQTEQPPSLDTSDMNSVHVDVATASPVRVDEQIEVIDLDEEPRTRVSRRRNSFDQAQEFGNILNL